MNTILNEEINYQNAAVSTSFVSSPKTAKISGMLSLTFAVLAVISIFAPFLFWNFLLISVSLSVFGFLEINSGKAWLSTITWIVSLALLILLFILAFDSVRNPPLYFYGAFSIIVPILMTINALTGKNSAIWKAFLPLLIPAFFIIFFIFLSSGTAYWTLLLLPLGWGFLGLVNYLESKN